MPDTATALLRRPSAWLPILTSAVALGLVLGYAVLVGPGEPGPHDERAPARLFQLILLVDALAIAVFAVRWLSRSPRQAALVLALQLVAAAIPILTVLLLESRL